MNKRKRDDDGEKSREERLAYVGVLAAGLIHEIKTPLHAILLTVQMLVEDSERLPPDIRPRFERRCRRVHGEVKSLARLDSVVAEIKDKKFLFEDAVAYLSSDKDTRRNNGLMVNSGDNSNFGTSRFEMEQLPPEVAKAIQSMKVGEVSAPFRMKQRSNGKDVVAIVKLKSRVDGHIANVSDDYQTLKNIVESRKKEEILRKWLQTKIKDTYIRIDDNWKNCDFQYSGWVK